MTWHIEGCTGACLACLIEALVMQHYGTEGLGFLRRYSCSQEFDFSEIKEELAGDHGQWHKEIDVLKERLSTVEGNGMKFTEREIELLTGMMQTHLNHAERCDAIPNRPMANKQKGWDMERVELLKRIIEAAEVIE